MSDGAFNPETDEQFQRELAAVSELGKRKVRWRSLGLITALLVGIAFAAMSALTGIAGGRLWFIGGAAVTAAAAEALLPGRIRGWTAELSAAHGVPASALGQPDLHERSH